MGKRQIRLSRKGIMLSGEESSNSATDNEEPKFDWTDAFIDATIAAGVTFFTCLTAIGIAGLLEDPQKALLACGIAAAGSFVAWLAMKRNIKVED